MVGIEPLSPKTPLIDEVTETIRAAILGGTFHAGEQIFQADVARRLQVSRGPVREALRFLIGEGLVREEPRRGTFVVSPGPEDVREIYDLRVALEVRAGQLVLRGNARETLENMGRALNSLVVAVEHRDVEHIAAADLAFHESLCRGSGNQRLVTLFRQQSVPVRQLIRIDEASYYNLSALVGEHRVLLAELRRGNADVFAALLTEHIEEARDRLIAYIEANTRQAEAG